MRRRERALHPWTIADHAHHESEGVNSRIQGVLNFMKLGLELQIYDDCDEALAKLQP